MLTALSRATNVTTKSAITEKLENRPVSSMEATLRNGRRDISQPECLQPGYRGRIPWRFRMIETEAHDDDEAKLERIPTRMLYEMGVPEKPRDVGLNGMDRLVQDLLASQKSLEEEKTKVADRDAEIARLKEEVAHLLDRAREDGQKRETAEVEVRELERMSALLSVHDEEINELRRLLAFHKTNGGQVSRKFRDLQAINKDLQVQLQVVEMTLGDQVPVQSGVSAVECNSSDS